MNGALAAGIPGTPAGLAWLAERYGNLPLATSLAPAMRLAADGFEVDARYVAAARFRAKLLQADPGTARVFLAGGEVPAPGYVVRQPELAQTLAALAVKGRSGFYAGEVARRLVAGVQMAGGIWELDDLAGYRVVEREPARITYRGAQITCASLPSSGGLVLTEVLQILERYPLATLSRPQRDHFVVEALRRGYQDRARYMGDPDFVTPPAAALHARLCRRSGQHPSALTRPRPARSSIACTRFFPRATTPRTSRWWTRKATASPQRSASTCRSVRAWWPATPGCCSTTR